MQQGVATPIPNPANKSHSNPFSAGIENSQTIPPLWIKGRKKVTVAIGRLGSWQVCMIFLVELSNISFWNFRIFRPETDFLVLFLGIGALLVKIYTDIYILPQSLVHFDPGKDLKNRDLEISEIPNIDELDRIYMASPRGLTGGKTEPPDYILMFSSANDLCITYKINFGYFCHPWLTRNIWEFHQVCMIFHLRHARMWPVTCLRA